MPAGKEKFSPIWIGVFEFTRKLGGAGVVVVADRLFQPVDIFRIERAAALERLIHAEHLIVVDHQMHIVADALAYRVHGGDIALKRRIAEAQLDRAEVADGKQLLGLGSERAEIVHQAEAATVVGRDWFRLGAEHTRKRQPGGNRKRVPTGDVESGHRHAHDALHADQSETPRELRPHRGWIDLLALDHVLHLVDQVDDRRAPPHVDSKTDKSGR